MDETDGSIFKFLNKSKEEHDRQMDKEKFETNDKSSGCDEIDAPLGPKMSVPANTDVYNTDHPNLGIALIFNHKIIRGAPPRHGTEKDRDRLRKALLDYGFAVRTYDDKTFEEISDILDNVSKEDHTHNDCLCISVMTHGEPGKIFAKDMTYPVDRLWKPFLGSNCKSLINKPKMFFIQACRGEKLDDGVQFRGFTTMSRSLDETDAEMRPVTFTIPSTADLLVMYSTYDDSYSWRNPVLGSWFIQSLCEELERALRSREPAEFFRLLTAVSRRVAYQYQSNVPQNERMDEMKEMPNFISTLTKIFYLKEKN